MFSRADRRHEAERLKTKRSKYSGTGAIMAETPKSCSCWMCGNPRKWFQERTVQEQRLFQKGAL